MSTETSHVASEATFRGITEEIVEALADAFRPSRLFTATVGLALTFVLSLSLGALAGTLLIRNLLGEASLVAVGAALVLYVGLLLTFGALCRMAAAERVDEPISTGAAFGFAFARAHVVLGLPVFALLVALGLGALGVRIGFETGQNEVAGPALGPLVLVILFALNLLLILALLLTHALAAPCVACTELPLPEVVGRLARVTQERLHQFLAYQSAALVVALPLTVLMAVVFLAAFQPAFQSVASGRMAAEARVEEAARPVLPPPPPPPAEPGGTLRDLRRWVESDLPAAGGAPLVGVAALALLLLGVVPLTFAAGAQTAVYLGVASDRVVVSSAAPKAAEAEPVAAVPERHPPIVHCWRCDAINRFEADACAKCGATFAVCRSCFATTERGRANCSSCGHSLTEEPVEEEVTARAV